MRRFGREQRFRNDEQGVSSLRRARRHEGALLRPVLKDYSNVVGFFCSTSDNYLPSIGRLGSVLRFRPDRARSEPVPIQGKIERTRAALDFAREEGTSWYVERGTGIILRVSGRGGAFSTASSPMTG